VAEGKLLVVFSRGAGKLCFLHTGSSHFSRVTQMTGSSYRPRRSRA
jgi:hypothetical protein